MRMKKGLALFLAVVILLSACQSKRATTSAMAGKVPVVVSILPLADLTAQVGGDRVVVTDVVVPPGSSPHTFEPTPSQIKAVAQAKMLIVVGLGLEYWTNKVVDAADNKGLQVVVTSDGIKPISGAESSNQAVSENANPHIWLDPMNAIIMVQHIRDALIRVDPAGKAIYEANAAAYIKKLKALDREIRGEVATFRSKKFIAFHPAWVYFAREYGLEEAAVIERSPGHEPSPAEVAFIVKTARKLGAKAIFAEPQFSAAAAKTIAEESGARVLYLDPIGSSLKDYSYLNLIRYNVDQMAKALQ